MFNGVPKGLEVFKGVALRRDFHAVLQLPELNSGYPHVNLRVSRDERREG